MATLSYPSSRALLLPIGVSLLGISVVALGLWSRSHVLVEYAYPGVALLVAGLLYATRPAHYLGFMWWIWFVTPFVRRLADYQALTFSSASPVMLTPYLVAGLCLVTLFRFGGHLRERRYAPVRLALLGIGYGYLVGIALAGPSAATFDLLEWATPVLVGFHVLVLWDQYPEHRGVLRTTFGWGVLVLGAYGVLQFIAPAPWDVHWMTASGMTSSIGQPEAYEIRVFSTLNSPGPFAMVMMAGLLLLLDSRGLLARIAAAPGYASFLLSLVRAAWGAWLVGLLYAALGFRGAARRRLLVVLGVGAFALLPLTVYAPLAERVSHRFESFSKLEEDTSFKARWRLYTTVTGRVISNPVGQGLGSLGRAAKLNAGQVVSIDSGLLAIPLTLGWIGTAFYLAGLVGMMRGALRARARTRDPFAIIACAVAVGYLWALVFANQVTGVKGVVLWTFMALAVAAGVYHDDDAARTDAASPRGREP